MSYKRVVERNGKRYGPYIYESYRDENGNVKKRYLGKVEEKRKLPLQMIFVVGILVIAFLFGASYTTDLIFNKGEISGNFIDSVGNLFSEAYGGLTGLVIDEGVDTGAPSEAPKKAVKEEKEVKEEAKEEVREDKVKEEKVPVKETPAVEEVPVEEVPVEEVPVSEDIVSLGDEEPAEPVVNETTEVPVEEVENVTEELVVEEPNITIEEPVEEIENVTEGNVTVVNETVVEVPIENVTEVPVEEIENVTEVPVEEIENITAEVPIENVTEIVNETLENITEVVENITVANITEVSTLQYKAVVGRPVKWIKSVNVTDGNLSIEIPLASSNISVLTNGEIDEALTQADEYENTVDDADREDVVSGGLLTGNVALDISKGKGWLTRFWNWITSFGITGNVILEEEIVGDIVETKDKKIVKLDKVVNESGAKKVAVEYYTESPVAREKNLSNGKRVVVSAPSELNYTEILAYALIEGDVKMGDPSLKVYWYIDEEKGVSAKDLLESGSSSPRISVDYESFDFDNDGFVDYVEWVVPHLSAQVYEVIYITKAEHLDTNREFISDIYDDVKAQDDNWSEVVGDGEYVRVTFEKLLDNTKDITIYARSAGNESASVDVYEVNGTEVLATFDNVSDGNWSKIYLTELNGTQDVFDLRVNGEVEFDYIVDPTPLTDCQGLTAGTSYTLTADIANAPDDCFSINGDDIIFDCQGHIIDGAGTGEGFTSSASRDNITIKNCTITEFSEGIRLWATNSSVSNISIYDSGMYGFDANNVYMSNISNIYAENSVRDGLFLSYPGGLGSQYSTYTNITVNGTTDSGYGEGIFIKASTSSTVGNFNNVFRHIRIYDAAKTGITTESDCVNNTFDDVEIYNSATNGMRVVTAKDWPFENNVFNDIYIEDSGDMGFFYDYSTATGYTNHNNFTNIIINGTANTGFYIDRYLYNSTLENISAYNIGDGTSSDHGFYVSYTTDGNYFTDIHVENVNGGDGFYISYDGDGKIFDGLYSNNVTLNGLYFYSGNFIESDYVIKNAYINNSGARGMYFHYGWTAIPAWANWTFENVTIDNSGTNGFYLENYMQNSSFTDMAINHSGADAMWFSDETNNNNFTGVSTGITSGDGIELAVDSYNNTFSNCDFRGATGYPFNANKANGLLIYGSYFDKLPFFNFWNYGQQWNTTVGGTPVGNYWWDFSGCTAVQSVQLDGESYFACTSDDYTVNGIGPNVDYGPLVIPDTTIDFVNPTPDSGTMTTNTSIIINVSMVMGTGDMEGVVFNWNGSETTYVPADANLTNPSGSNWVLYLNMSNLTLDTLYTYQAFVNDSFFGLIPSETRTVQILAGSPAPNMTMNSPENITYDTASILFNVTAVDDENNVSWCNYSLDGGASVPMTNTYGQDWNATNSSMLDGGHTVVFTCMDNHFSSNSTSMSFGVDTTAPAIDYGLNTEIDYENKSRDWIYVNVSVSDLSTYNTTFYLYNSSGEVNSTPYSSAVTSINWTGLVDGDYWYNVTATDVFGQANTTVVRYITLDTVIPLIEFGLGIISNGTIVAQDWIWANVTVVELNEKNITFNLYNAGGLVNSTTLPAGSRILNWTDLSDAIYYYNVTVFDFSGNSNSTDTASAKLENPLLSVFSPLNLHYYNTSTIWFNATSTAEDMDMWMVNWNGTDVILSAINTTEEVEDGYFNLILKGNNSINDWGLNDTIWFGVDTTYPLIDYGLNTEIDTANLSQNYIYVNVTVVELNETNITFNLYNSSDLVNSTVYTTPVSIINWTNLPDEDYWYNVTVVDIVSNTNTSETRKLTLDNIVPLIDYGLNTEDNDTDVSQDWIYVNVSVTETNEMNITFSLYNSTDLVNKTTFAPGVRTINWTNLIDGPYYYNVTVADGVGVSNSTGTRRLDLDSTFPLIDYGLNTEINESIVNHAWIYVNISVIELNEANITFELYNSVGFVNSTTYSTAVRTINWTNLPDNTYWYNVTVVDTVNNINSTDTRKIITDIAPPTMNVFSPINTTYDTSTIWFNASANEVISTWIVNYNGTNTTLSGVNTSLEVEDGSYQLLLYANDSANNFGLNDSVYFTVDTTNPLIDYGVGTGIDTANLSQDFVYVNVSVTEINEANITFNLYNSSGLVNSTTHTDSSRNITWTGLLDGVYSYNVTITDDASNSNSTLTREITLDTTNPAIDYDVNTEVSTT
ncbi:MAG: hypothetical protein OEL89_01255, partial [Candidatus Peregrinibacteria bacterium]|nr:hypothetical protein [Candidatus Peregrinibacteria bacterium]